MAIPKKRYKESLLKLYKIITEWFYKTFKFWQPIIIVFTALCTVFIGYQRFIVEDIQIPNSYPANLNINSRLERAGIKDSVIALKITVSFKNNSKQRTNLTYCYYNIRVSNVLCSDDDLSDSIKLKELNRDSLDIDFNECYSTDSSMIIQSGRFNCDDWWFDANEESEGSFIIYIPNKYDDVKLDVGATILKDKIPKECIPKWICNEDKSIGVKYPYNIKFMNEKYGMWFIDSHSEISLW